MRRKLLPHRPRARTPTSEGALIGGEHNSQKPDASAFLFTLTNPHEIAPTILAFKGSENAIWQRSNYGAIFGGKNPDLCFVAHCNTEPGSISNLGTYSYADPTGKGNALFTGTRPLGTMVEILAFSV